MEWTVDGQAKKISIDFSAPPAGSEKDYVNTLIATGEYPDIMTTSYCTDSVVSLYEQGVAIDLTDYIEQYMPNYLKRVNADPTIGAQLVNSVDGEKKFLQLFTLADTGEDQWCGYEYRRDWIVKYGTNPETDEAFSGS